MLALTETLTATVSNTIPNEDRIFWTWLFSTRKHWINSLYKWFAVDNAPKNPLSKAPIEVIASENAVGLVDIRNSNIVETWLKRLKQDARVRVFNQLWDWHTFPLIDYRYNTGNVIKHTKTWENKFTGNVSCKHPYSIESCKEPYCTEVYSQWEYFISDPHCSWTRRKY